jgi:tetratricopeptide (TPR) repeat protein
VRKSRQHIYFLAAAVALITVLVYLSCLKNEFVNWDDDRYIVENPFIRSLDASFLKWAFFDFYAYNWHPLTWISHALDYAICGLKPLGHHLTNIILHAINTFIVVFLVIRLLEAWNKRTIRDGPPSFLNERAIFVAAGITGLLFGLHPLHVESVAWAAERKDLLCSLFFLLSLVLYTKNVNDEGMNAGAWPRFFNKRYLGALGLFVLALMSKPMAVSLPVVLLILDWHPFGRIRSLNTAASAIAEKLPFIALSVLASVVTIMAQRAGGAMTLNDVVPLSTRVLVAAQSLVVYLRKMVWPADLVPFYPYPRTASPASFEYLFPLVLIAGITAACIALSGKRKVWLSTWAFYTATLIPVLGIVQVGDQSMADRYTYLPSLGPFLIAGLGAARIRVWADKAHQGTAALSGAAVLLVISLSYGTTKQIGTWNNSIDLWSSVIQQYPGINAITYNNRALAYQKRGLYDQAIADFDQAIAINPFADKAYNNRAVVDQELGLFDRATKGYDQAIALNPSNHEAYNNLGVLYARTGSYRKAIENFNKALAVKPDYAEAFVNCGMTYALLGLYDNALESFNKAIGLKSDLPRAYSARGKLYLRTGKTDLAMVDLQKACALGNRDACNAVPYFTGGLLSE